MKQQGVIFGSWLGCLLAVALVMGCNNHSARHRVLVLQPFADFSLAEARQLAQQIAPFHDQIRVNKPLPFRASAWVPARARYRADTLLRQLNSLHGRDTLVVGLTHTDISTTKGQVADWGVMGLGYRPGKACVVSSFRLQARNRREQFLKVLLHEIGHTYGLPHCPVPSCLMRDAKGKNPLDAEKDFCARCKEELRGLGFGGGIE